MATCGTKLKPGRPRSAAVSKAKLKLKDVKETFAVEKSGRKRALSLSFKKLEEADCIACLGEGKAPAEPVVCLMCHKAFHRVYFVQNHAMNCPKLKPPKKESGILAYLGKKVAKPFPESNDEPSPEPNEVVLSDDESDEKIDQSNVQPCIEVNDESSADVNDKSSGYNNDSEEIDQPNAELSADVNDEPSGDANDATSPESNEVEVSDEEFDEEIDQPYDESPGEDDDDDGPSKWRDQFRWHFLLKDLRHLKYCMDNKVSVQWKSFYHEPAHPLLAKNHSLVTHHRRRVCIWHPELFFPKLCPVLTCPDCRGPLTKRGWNKQGPRLVTGLGEEYFVLCRQHSCTNCKKTFLGYSQKLLNQLPFVIKNAFPCMIFRKAALDKALVAMLKRQITSGQSFEDFRLMLEELLNISYLRHKVTYLTLSVESSAPVIDDFSDFKFRSDSETYPGRVPSSNVLKEAYTQAMSREKEKKQNYVASLKGKILCGDHTFKARYLLMRNMYLLYIF